MRTKTDAKLRLLAGGSWHQGGGEIMRNRRQVVVAGRCDHETQGLLIKTDAARWPIERWNHGLVQQSGHTLADLFSGAGAQKRFGRAVEPRHGPARAIIQVVWARKWFLPSNRVGTPPARRIRTVGVRKQQGWSTSLRQSVLPEPSRPARAKHSASIHLRLVKCPNPLMSSNES